MERPHRDETPGSEATDNLDVLNAFHQEIGGEFLRLLDGVEDWERARVMVQYRDGEDYQLSLRHLSDRPRYRLAPDHANRRRRAIS